MCDIITVLCVIKDSFQRTSACRVIVLTSSLTLLCGRPCEGQIKDCTVCFMPAHNWCG